MYYFGISEDIIKEQFKHEKEDIKIEYRVQDKVGAIKVDICFCKGNKALWIAKFKKKYYGNMVKNIVRADKYTNIAVFYQLRENAIKTLQGLRGI